MNQGAAAKSFLARHEFLIRRLHSLSGLVPVGAYMVIHLTTNASVLDGAGTFQRAVYQIHSLGIVLPLVEWGFIFLPLLFHAIIGVVIIRGGLPNTSSYPYSGNIRYLLQRISGMIALVFILWHVFHMHGWFHFEAWREFAESVNGSNFRPYNAASTLGLAMQGVWMPLFYLVGVLACVFHLANGIWTMGITWGVWTSTAAQRRAGWLCLAFGIGIGILGVSALGGAMNIDVEEAQMVEDDMYREKLRAREVQPDEHKRSYPLPEESEGRAEAGRPAERDSESN